MMTKIRKKFSETLFWYEQTSKNIQENEINFTEQYICVCVYLYNIYVCACYIYIIYVYVIHIIYI